MRTHELALRAATVSVAAAGLCALTGGVAGGVAAAATGAPTPLPPLPSPVSSVVTTVQQTVTTTVDKVTGTPDQQPGKPPVKSRPTATTRQHRMALPVPSPATHTLHRSGSAAVTAAATAPVPAARAADGPAVAAAQVRLITPRAATQPMLGSADDNAGIDRHGLLLAIATLAAAVVAVGHLRVETVRWQGVTLVAVAR